MYLHIYWLYISYFLRYIFAPIRCKDSSKCIYLNIFIIYFQSGE